MANCEELQEIIWSFLQGCFILEADLQSGVEGSAPHSKHPSALASSQKPCLVLLWNLRWADVGVLGLASAALQAELFSDRSLTESNGFSTSPTFQANILTWRLLNIYTRDSWSFLGFPRYRQFIISWNQVFDISWIWAWGLTWARLGGWVFSPSFSMLPSLSLSSGDRAELALFLVLMHLS